MRITSVLGLLTLACVVGCGDEQGTSGDKTEGALLPWAQGNKWTYRVTDNDGNVTEKVTEIMPVELVSGMGPNSMVMANKVITRKSNGNDETHSWQAAMGDKIVRYREISFSMSTGMANLEEHWDPYKLRLDGSPDRVKDNANWIEVYSETKIAQGVAGTPQQRQDLWRIRKASEKVVVPGGEWDAVVVERISASDSSKLYWFVRGVGKVKETGGQTEELVSWDLQ